MSENNKPELITAEAELVKPEPRYDFIFITQALGLIPIKRGTEAINPSAITNVYRDEDDPSVWIFALAGEEACAIDDSDMPEFEAQLRMRAEVARQMMQGGGLIAAPTGRRYRQ